MSKIVLLEFIDEFTEFQNFVKKNNLDINNFTIVALEHELQAHLKKSGINFKNSLSYIGNDSFKRILLKFDDIRKYIENNFDFIDKNSIRNAYVGEFLHYLELIINYICKIFEILRGIYEENKDAEIYVCEKSYIGNSVFISDDRLLKLLVEKFAKKNNINFYLFGYAYEQKSSTLSKKAKMGISLSYLILLSILKNYSKVFNKSLMLIPTKNYGFKQLLSEIKKRNSNVLFITLYDNGNVKWYQKYFGLISGVFSNNSYIDINSFSDNTDLQEKDVLKDKIMSLFDKKLDSIFDFYEIDFKDILKDKVKNGIIAHLQQMLLWSYMLRCFTQNFDIKTLMSPFGRGIWYIAAEMLTKRGKISLFVSHGTHPVPINQYHEISIFNMCRGFMLGDYSHIAISTPVQKLHLQYFKNKYKNIKNEEINTEPLIFANITETDRLKNRTSFGFLRHEKVIVHAVSLKWRGMERYYFLETIDEYFSDLADIVSAVNKIDNARLIIRLHPGIDLNELRLFLPESDKYIINSSGQFKDVLSSADLLISYSSTTIDEALINKIPVLLYDKWNRYNHFQTGVYETRESEDIFPVCYVSSRDKLDEALQFMLEKNEMLKKEDFDITKYKYAENYKDNFYRFIKKTLKQKGESSEDSRYNSCEVRHR